MAEQCARLALKKWAAMLELATHVPSNRADRVSALTAKADYMRKLSGRPTQAAQLILLLQSSCAGAKLMQASSTTLQRALSVSSATTHQPQ